MISNEINLGAIRGEYSPMMIHQMSLIEHSICLFSCKQWEPCGPVSWFWSWGLGWRLPGPPTPLAPGERGTRHRWCATPALSLHHLRLLAFQRRVTRTDWHPASLCMDTSASEHSFAPAHHLLDSIIVIINFFVMSFFEIKKERKQLKEEISSFVSFWYSCWCRSSISFCV